MYPYIEVINMKGRKFTICVDDISSVEERQENNNYADITLKTTGRIIQTGNSYSDICAKLHMVYNTGKGY